MFDSWHGKEIDKIYLNYQKLVNIIDIKPTILSII